MFSLVGVCLVFRFTTRLPKTACLSSDIPYPGTRNQRKSRGAQRYVQANVQEVRLGSVGCDLEKKRRGASTQKRLEDRLKCSFLNSISMIHLN